MLDAFEDLNEDRERDTTSSSHIVAPPKKVLDMICDSMEIIDTIREKRLEESEKAYMLLYIAGVVPEVGDNFSESIKDLNHNVRRQTPRAVVDFIRHINMHALNAYSRKLKALKRLRKLAIAARKVDGTVALEYEDFRVINMFHLEYVVMKIEREFSKDLQLMADRLLNSA